MRKLASDRHGNEGWAVRARKPHRCELRNNGCQGIGVDQWYYRGVAWPGSDANGSSVPWILRICRDCLHDDRRLQFDMAVDPEIFGVTDRENGSES